MKRNDDVLRQILFEIESQEDWVFHLPQFISMPKDDRLKYGHICLLCDAGFVAEVGNGTFRLTNDGHDYLDAIRSDTIWNNTKNGASKVGGMTLEMMRDLAIAYLKQEAAEKLGIQL